MGTRKGKEMRVLWIMVVLSLMAVTARAQDPEPADDRALNAALVNRLIEQRLKTIGLRAVAAAMKNLDSDIGGSAPVRDLVQALTGVVDPRTDPETRMEVLRGALVRVGLTVLVLEAMKSDASGCMCDGGAKWCGKQLEAAYEGLAASKLGETWVFPEADEELCLMSGTAETLPECLPGPACEAFRRAITDKVNCLTDLSQIAPLSSWEEMEGIAESCQVGTTLKPWCQGLESMAEHANACARGINTNCLHQKPLREFNLDHPSCAAFKADFECLTRLQKLQTLINKGITPKAESLSCSNIKLLVGKVVEVLQGVPEPRLGIDGAKVLRGVLKELPYILTCDGENPPRIDIPGLAGRIGFHFEEETRPGFYLRATVGSGYVMSGATGLVPLVYEEIGVGYRVPVTGYRLLLGPHLAASGVVHRMVLDDEAQDAVFLVLGVAANWDGLIELSVGLGPFITGTFEGDKANPEGDKESTDLKGRGLFVVGLHLPLSDYIEAAAAALSD
jgi:hypothetical protein